MTDTLYNCARRLILCGDLTREVRCLLVNGYYPDPMHRETCEIVGEVRAPGYLPGGKRLKNASIDEYGVFQADDVVWPFSEIAATGCVIAVPGGLICYLDFGAVVHSVHDSFTVEWARLGIVAAI